MLRNILLGSLLIGACTLASAQVTMSYDATVSQGTYTPLSGATVVPTSSLSGTDLSTVVFSGDNTANTAAVTAQGYPIGFDFKFDNKLMNQFFIGAHGYLVLGKDQVSASATTNCFFIFSNSTDSEVIGTAYRSEIYGLPETEISYLSTGTSPNRVLTVQYKNLGLAVDNWGEISVRDTVDLQIALYEDGHITFCFNGFQPDANTTLNYNDSFKMGIRGTGDDRLMKSSSFTDDQFSTDDNIISWSQTNYPTDGLTYTFTPPEDCAKPTAQPTGLTLTSTSTAVSGSFTASADADHYLVLISDQSSLSENPVDGTVYAKDDVIGNATVISYDTLTTFATDDNLENATDYYIYVFGANSYCFYGPKYNTTSPLTAQSATLAAAPQSLTVASTDTTSVTLNVQGNAADDDVLIAWTTTPAQNEWDQIIQGGTFGTPSGTLAVGDEIEGGGTVLFKGKAQDGILLEGLSPYTKYFFRAWSIDDNGNYSTSVTDVTALTACTETWNADFDSMPLFETVGWSASDNANWMLNQSTSGFKYLELRTSGDATNGTIYDLVTPDIYLSEVENRVVFTVNMTSFAHWSYSPYVFTNDTLSIQVAGTDGQFNTVANYTKDNMPEFTTTDTYVKLYVPFFEAAGERANVRLRFKVYGSPTVKINMIRVEEKLACDYPINVSVPDSTIFGSTAVVNWTPQGEEESWDVSYKRSDSTTWSEPVTVNERKCTLTGLEGLTNYDVRVRARCSAASQSQWSEICTFKSGLAVPFMEVFSEEESEPAGWSSKTGELATPSVLTDGGLWSFSSGWWSSSLSYANFTEGTVNDWYITPKFDLGDGSVKYNVIFGITKTYAGTSTDNKLQIVVAADGENFNAEDTVLTIPADQMGEDFTSDVFTASLSGYQGAVRLGILLTSTNGYPLSLTVDSLGVDFSCKNDAADFQVTDTTTTSFKAQWTGTAEKWLVFLRKEGETTKNYVELTEPVYEATGLEPQTNYELGITKSCEPGDTALVKIFEVTTLTDTRCPEPTDLKATPKDYSAVLSWSGDAYCYNVRWRQTDAADWTLVSGLQDTTLTLNDLEPETEYEFMVQAMGSKLASDTSDYTAAVKFTTLPIQCAVPTDITVEPSYYSATVNWVGAVEKYQLQWREQSAETWNTMEVTEMRAEIENLQPVTTYMVRLRSICDDGDSSKWSSSVSFTTLELPECVTPTNLTADAITDNSAILSWHADESNLTWNLRYRESTASAWTEVNELNDTTYQLDGLKEQTSYIWRVMATCEYNESKWAAQKRFTTVATGIDQIGISGLTAFVKNRTLNVLNPEGGLIRSISVYDEGGRLIATYEVETTDNVFVRLNVAGPVIIRVQGQREVKTLHAIVK
ncbi:MAG: fibronectin type III domain-containing protein [Prevotella sp.]|jgi:hypothetical protein